MPFLLRLLGSFSIPLDRQPNPSSQFFGASVCSIDYQYLLDLLRYFYHRYLLDTSQFIEFFFFSIKAQYLLDLSRYVFLYISKVRFNSFQTQVSRYLLILSRSKPLLFTTIPLPFKFTALSKHPFLGKCSKSHLFFFIHAFHAFSDLTFGFFKNLGFLSFYEKFWVGFY